MGFERAAFGFHFIWKIENSDTNSDSNDSQRSHQSFHERVEILQTALRDALSSASDANQSILRLGAPKPMLENDTVFGSEKVAKKRLKKNSFDRNAERKKSSQPKRLKLKDEEFSDSNRNEPLGKLVDNSENYLTPNCIDSSDMTTSDAESFSFERNDIYDSLESSIKIGNILYPDDLPSVSEFKKKSFSEINIGEEETQCNQRPSVADSEHFEFKKPSKIRCTLIMSDDD